MPFLELRKSPHARGVSPVQVHYRDVGRGKPVVFLHGGWGYGAYPIDRQLDAFATRARFIIPDRSGHGRSSPLLTPLPIDFHRRAAEETLAVLDALGIKRATFWGHSDGAVIAALIGLSAPERCDRLILEAFHFYRNKPRSHGFFSEFAEHPENVNEKMRELLAADHGAENWQLVVQRNCKVWLELAAQSSGPLQDLYGGRLAELKVPVTFVHGRGDPRTEPDEMARVRKTLPEAEVRFVEDGRHSPHSENASCDEFNRIFRELIVSE
jgi:pimeloyl-ACP methyl ester carboxylesterase